MNNSRTTPPTTPTTTTSPRDIVETHTNVRQNNSTPTHDCGGFLIVVSFVCFILFFVLISVLSSVLPHKKNTPPAVLSVPNNLTIDHFKIETGFLIAVSIVSITKRKFFIAREVLLFNIYIGDLKIECLKKELGALY
ncbi:hypothetical protein BpHYR1_042306 [Brachionus plicatilis]|uniref:Transmembrane protein n=1 Tax=Brachionus plicatilis TaxID=10195 RepID=A0A3M7TA56_BRAPC|nr:hypothetical protein BpHYR1_042306 [Brachionus plicatilis]